MLLVPCSILADSTTIIIIIIKTKNVGLQYFNKAIILYSRSMMNSTIQKFKISKL